jgi:DNA-binding NtrC family response regulator
MGDEEKGRPLTMKEIERLAIRAALHRNGGVVIKAARELKISRASFYRKLKKYRKEAEDAVAARELI